MNLLQVPIGCRCNLEWAAKLVGCLELILYTTLIIVTSVALASSDDYASDSDDSSEQDVDQLYGIFVATLILQCVALIIVPILLYGVHKKRMLLLRPWMVLTVADFVLTVISVIINSIHLAYAYGTLYNVMLFLIVFGPFWIVTKFIFFLVVYKYHKMLMNIELERIRRLVNDPQPQHQQVDVVPQQPTQVPYQQSSPPPYRPPDQMPYDQPNPVPYHHSQQMPYNEFDQMPQQQSSQTSYQEDYDHYEYPSSPETSYEETSEKQKKNKKCDMEEPALIYTNFSSNKH